MARHAAVPFEVIDNPEELLQICEATKNDKLHHIFGKLSTGESYAATILPSGRAIIYLEEVNVKATALLAERNKVDIFDVLDGFKS